MTEEKQKPILIARAVSIEEMFNLINDKLDYLLAKQAEEKK